MSDEHNPSHDEPQAGELFGDTPAAQLRIDSRQHQRMITPSLIDAVPARCVVAAKPVVCFWIKGVANGVDRIDHPDHPETTFSALVGEFEAGVYQGHEPDPETAAVKLYTAGYCFLPGGFHEACLSRMAVMDADELTTKGLPFHLEFAAEPREGKAQYRWVARNLMRVVAAVGRLAAMDREAALVRNAWKQQALAGPPATMPHTRPPANAK